MKKVLTESELRRYIYREVLREINQQNLDEGKFSNALKKLGIGAAMIGSLASCDLVPEPETHLWVPPGATQVDNGSGSKSSVLDLEEFHDSHDWEGLSDSEGYVYQQYGVSSCASDKHDGRSLVVCVMFDDPDSEKGYRCWRYYAPAGSTTNYMNKLIDVDSEDFEPFNDKILINGEENN